jgi:glycogen debranching enzyme
MLNSPHASATWSVTTPPSLQGEERERKHRVLTRGTPSITSTIADAVVLKDGDLFLLTESDGRVPVENDHGFGLYHHDCRYLNAYELRLGDTYPVVLGSTAEAGGTGVFQLTNPDLQVSGRTAVQKEWLGIRWERRLDGNALAMSDRIEIQNWHREPVEVPLELRFGAEFEDIYQVRGLLRERHGNLHPPEWQDGRLVFRYVGGDDVERSLAVALSSGFEPSGKISARTTMRLAARGRAELSVELSLHEASRIGDSPVGTAQALSLQVQSDSRSLSRIVTRAVLDLDLLRSSMHGHEFYTAGIPWFATLFGRDSLISALQVLPFQPAMARDTLRLLARYQGQRQDDWRDEQPGKLPHELRRGEMAVTGMIPHSPYYGSVDATPLFLILLGHYTTWTGDLALFRELRSNVGRAIEWMRRYGDADGDGYIEYRSTSEHGLINQGWKDSGDAIVEADGRLATPPIAMVEVQAYAYLARRLMADLFRRCKDDEAAERLTAEADRLRRQFNQDFWVEEIGCFAMALEAEKRPLAVVSSNPGHALWTGIADPDKAAATIRRLIAEDMFSGWGVRTLSAKESCYTPIGYHLGTVWPHDNAFFAAGCRRHGFDEVANRIFDGITEAALHFHHARLPELFTGFSRAEYGVPIRYPVACHPQAWAAGSIPFFLQVLFGLEADGFAPRLRVNRPILPERADIVELRGIRVAGATIDLRFHRSAEGGVEVETVRQQGDLDVVVESMPRRNALET